ncbi:ImmA/IrrE family metallo-endopeptidase [Desulfolutivibrio sulfoxidireducens]|uniref:ImmA/IrrE family metallo-endopeptidase n=1 Tax=Desulfolutivibrio sulfoxidireducens TaxID=2773299 RepID=UPI00159E4FF3|nr:ImmA/IrrE family metallo-endopeptidase [Desulfolutivibrio sulfoxidireducens]QLA15245.1 ImmA/IrrE family metallo-endopeptidase [Desulfolutivibrio sulfoxidireducens]QLA18813.1 ImmA/IrrE family metallo-endopeptidase [Desulfolutivibrio sulfoxidireducens]
MMHIFGSRDLFAIEFELIPDPDAGKGALPEEEKSWGKLKIWADNFNICQHTYDFATKDEVTWYLYPVLEWLSKNWYPILYEEQPPFPVEKSVARAMFFEASKQVFGIMDDEKGEAWYRWGQRHSFRSCSNGGIFPDLFIRAISDAVEFSWGNAAIPGMPEGFYFNAPFGSAVVKRDVVQKVLIDFSDNLIKELSIRCPSSERLLDLQRSIDINKDTDRTEQVHWMIPALRAKGETENIVFMVVKKFINEISDAFIPAPVLMFGSLSPEVNDHDVEIINRYLAVDEQIVDNFLNFCTIESSTGQKPYEAGYDLAQEFSEVFFLKYDIKATPEAVVEKMGLQVIEENFSDPNLRGIALAGKNVTPKIFINVSNTNNQSENGKRFAISHEICHLLCDRQYGQEVGISSGPWAPLGVEQRANAFAAMLLMPIEVIEEKLQTITTSLEFGDILNMSSDLRVSIKALIEHLFNIGVLDYSERDSFREENQRHHSNL